MTPTINMAAQKSPPSRLDLLREALTRPDQALKPQQPSQAAEFYPPTNRNRENGNWETDSLGAYEASGPSTGAHKKWYDLNLPAILERRLRRLENLLDKQISWNNEIQRTLTEVREEPPTAEPASKKTTRAKRPKTSGTR
ncbi:hypothetical protein BDW62DRAFT_210807 [Aspergillus aurantiobrunneus]